MIREKKQALKHILESSDGIHITGYLSNKGDLNDLKNQLRTTIDEAHESVGLALTPDEATNFLEPLEALLKDARILKRIKGNIGLFRNKNSFRILSVPVELERQCHVATTFHVKPLLRWIQNDKEFLILVITPDHARLYVGSQSMLVPLDLIFFEKSGERIEEGAVWLKQWLERLNDNRDLMLYIAGKKVLTDPFVAGIKHIKMAKEVVAQNFEDETLGDLFEVVRSRVRARAKQMLHESIFEFRMAEEEKLAIKNIFQISKAAVRGRIRKLIIADGIHVFGKIDKKTGGISIHPFDLDHEDDDILDDLAQAVLAYGGEVVVAPREEIPKGHPILAILEGESRKTIGLRPPNPTHQKAGDL